MEEKEVRTIYIYSDRGCGKELFGSATLVKMLNKAEEENKELKQKLEAKENLIKVLEKNHDKLIADYNELKEQLDGFVYVKHDTGAILKTYRAGVEVENEMLRDKVEALSYEKNRLRKQVNYYMDLYYKEAKENEALKKECDSWQYQYNIERKLFQDEERICKELLNKLKAIENIITGEEE